MMTSAQRGWTLLLLIAATACTASVEQGPSLSVGPTIDTPIASRTRVVIGDPIDVSALEGRIVVSSRDDLFVANADGSGLVRVTRRRGPEFDASWSPDGRRIVYRDSRRGMNRNDEVFVVDADGSGARNLTRDPANDWGPDWSPDGSTIVFNSDRDGRPMSGYLSDADGSGLRRIPTDVWIEYPAWSPDGERVAFMGGRLGASEYDIWVVDIDGRNLLQLTDSPGSDGWPAWSPDGTRIAFTSVRDDCLYLDAPECRSTGDEGPHHDVWVVNVDGSGLGRVTLEFGQFVTWSPDGRTMLVSGYDLYVIRPDGTGRASVEIDGLRGGVFPDWIE